MVAHKLRSLWTANKVLIPLIPNRVRTLLIAGKPRVVLVAEKLRSMLVANPLRTLLIGGGILLFVVAAVSVGLLIHSSSGMGDQQQEALSEDPNGKKIALGPADPAKATSTTSNTTFTSWALMAPA